MGSAPITSTEVPNYIRCWFRRSLERAHWEPSAGLGARAVGSASPQLPVSLSQICVGVGRSKDTDGFIRVSSGKKRGLVPADVLTEI